MCSVCACEEPMKLVRQQNRQRTTPAPVCSNNWVETVLRALRGRVYVQRVTELSFDYKLWVTEKQPCDLQEPETVSGDMVDKRKSPVLFVQKVNTQTYLLPRTWCLPARLCYLLASRIPLARWQQPSAVRTWALAGQAAGMCEFTYSVHLCGGGNDKGVFPEPKIRANPDSSFIPTSARPAGTLPGGPIDPNLAREPLKYCCLFTGLFPLPPWCHFQIHYIPMALGSFNYMWRNLAVAGIRQPVLTIYRPRRSHKQGNK